MVQIIPSFCGCITLLISDLYIIDSNRLPAMDIQVWKLIVDDTQELEIEETFLDIDELLVYLNTTFVSVYGLDGFFTLSDGTIYYSNPENFEKLEIVAIVKRTTIIFSIGDAPVEPNMPFTDIPVNTNTITDARINGPVVAVRIGGSNLEPIDINGWKQTGTTVAAMGPDVTFYDNNIYIEIDQTI